VFLGSSLPEPVPLFGLLVMKWLNGHGKLFSHGLALHQDRSGDRPTAVENSLGHVTTVWEKNTIFRISGALRAAFFHFPAVFFVGIRLAFRNSFLLLDA
jgi:hypothetical protein